MTATTRKDKVNLKKIRINHPLDWPIFDRSNQILFKQGSRIYTVNQLSLLEERDIHYLVDLKQEKLQNVDIFKRIIQLITFLALTFDAIIKKKPDCNQRVNRCIKLIDDICTEDSDAALGAILLLRDQPGMLLKPLFSGFLANMFGKRIRYPQSRQDDLVAGMILCNIASVSYQNKLDAQTTPLSDKQKEIIHRHPEEGVRILTQAGINNTNVLKTVLQHHERIDGSGYPRAASEMSIHFDAKIAAICDFYVAVTSKRSYKSVKKAKEALSEIYSKATSQAPYLHMEFIKELGAYPPGSIVNLANGDTAVITRRQKNVVAPMAKAVISPLGITYPEPMTRDCNKKKYKIIGTCNMDSEVRLDLPELWDLKQD